MTSLKIIENLKCVFSRQGIPDVVMSDNGPEFSSRIFREFSQLWKFQHITSSPRYPQSNGQVERAVQTIKSILKKTHFEGGDFHLALLEFLNTPISSKLPSPPELLNNRKLRSILPCQPKLLQLKIINARNAQAELRNRQDVQKKYFDKGSRNLKPFEVGERVKVRIDRQWVKGTVKGRVGPRSYTIKLYSCAICRRNRRQMILDTSKSNENSFTNRYDYDDISSPESSISLSSSAQQQSSNLISSNVNNYVTRYGRTVRPPDRWGHPVPKVSSCTQSEAT